MIRSVTQTVLRTAGMSTKTLKDMFAKNGIEMVGMLGQREVFGPARGSQFRVIAIVEILTMMDVDPGATAKTGMVKNL